MAYTQSFKVLFRHCDPAGIVFYPRYFEMINDCVEGFFDDIGFPFEDLHRNNAVPTAKITTTFKTPSRHGDRLSLELEVTHIGGSSLGVEISGLRGGDLRFQASSVLVHTGEMGRPEPWPTSLRAALTPHLRSAT